MLVYTSCVNNYIPKARILASSLKTFHPDWEFCLLLGEEPPAGFDLAREPFDRILKFADLDIPEYANWLFRHRVVEICTAAKGPALYYFLHGEKHDKVIYLDPDIKVFSHLNELEELLDSNDILLTPHQLAPQPTRKAIADNELCSLQYGVYNLGFLAVAGRGQGLDFAAYWRDRLYDYCYDDRARGLFTDQRWCDLAPAYFDRLHIVRDPGCNAASWNLADRTITVRNGKYYANDVPLKFYHFTGYDSGAGRIATAHYGAAMPAVAQLWAEYGEQLEASGQAELGKASWRGMLFSNGDRITDEMRLFYRNDSRAQTLFPDPFATDAAGNSGYLGYFRKIGKLEKNPLGRFARRASGLASLTSAYLGRHGGLRALPLLSRKVWAALRKGGVRGLTEQMRNYRGKI